MNGLMQSMGLAFQKLPRTLLWIACASLLLGADVGSAAAQPEVAFTVYTLRVQ